ncbi:BON domain-containing protein [Sphingomonas oryzagri]
MSDDITDALGLSRLFDPHMIDVSITEGRVILSGRVRSLRESARLPLPLPPGRVRELSRSGNDLIIKEP